MLEQWFPTFLASAPFSDKQISINTPTMPKTDSLPTQFFRAVYLVCLKMNAHQNSDSRGIVVWHGKGVIAQRCKDA